MKEKKNKILKILNEDLVFPDGLTFLEVLEKLNDKNHVEIDTRLLALVESKQKEFDELFGLLHKELVKYNLSNPLKIGKASRTLFNIYEIGVKHGR